MRRSDLPPPIFALALVLCPPTGAADVCATAQDQAAPRTRAARSDPMLAALNCDERDRYNLFVTRFRQPLIHESAALRAYFQRRHSAGATRRTAATRRVRRSGASVHFDATE